MPIRSFFPAFLIAFFMAVGTGAQKVNNVWVFGYHAGLDFNTDPPTFLDSTQNYIELPPGYISGISDKNGKHLFYTNGWAVWDGNHEVIPKFRNYWPWAGDIIPLVCPYPGNDSLYYLFGVSTEGLHHQLQYLSINMKGSGGAGAIVYPQPLTRDNYFTVLTPNASVLLTGTAHCNGKDTWIVVHSPGSLNSFLVTKDGVSATPVTTPVSAADIPVGNIEAGYSNLKFSANGERLVFPLPGQRKVVVFDFDNLSGRFTNPRSLNLPRGHQLEDVELSSNGSKLYLGTMEVTEIDPGVPGATLHHVFQMDLDAGSPAAIEQTLFPLTLPDRESCSPRRCNFVYRTMQLAPDGKIYVSMRDVVLVDAELNQDKTLSVIQTPDKKGPDAFYKRNAQDVGRKYKYINYNYIRSTSFTLRENGIIVQKKACFDKPVDFSLLFTKVDSVHWDFGDPASAEKNRSTSFTPQHLYPGPGTYTVRTIMFTRCLSDTATATFVIENIPSVQIPSYIKDTFACVGSQLTLDAVTPAATTYRWDNGLIYSKRTLDTAGIHSVTVYNECSIDRREFKFVYKECPCEASTPNAFTPNNDGLNDSFRPVVQCVAQDYQFRIYNRYGGVAFESTELNQGWNGKVGNLESPSGVYLWMLQYRNPNTKELFLKRGTVVLIR
jgi:gliding motility-associated-like protein